MQSRATFVLVLARKVGRLERLRYRVLPCVLGVRKILVIDRTSPRYYYILDESSEEARPLVASVPCRCF
jgi:hypothetical protein